MAEEQNTAVVAAGAPFGAMPKSWAEAWTLAQRLAKSTFVPKNFQGNPDDVLACMAYGVELGVRPMQALQNIAFISGRATVWGDLALALARQKPEWDENGFKEWEVEEEVVDERTINDPDGPKKVKTMVAYCEVRRKDREEVILRKYSMLDAEIAGLIEKATPHEKSGRNGTYMTEAGPWVTNPKRQRQMRARGFALRDGFSDGQTTFTIREEAQDYTEPEYDVETTATKASSNALPDITEDMMPRRASEVQAEAEPETPPEPEETTTELSMVDIGPEPIVDETGQHGYIQQSASQPEPTEEEPPLPPDVPEHDLDDIPETWEEPPPVENQDARPDEPATATTEETKTEAKDSPEPDPPPNERALTAQEYSDVFIYAKNNKIPVAQLIQMASDIADVDKLTALTPSGAARVKAEIDRLVGGPTGEDAPTAQAEAQEAQEQKGLL